ncbi:MAG: Gfo/Idh/MocA family oxidoreductase [Terriglobia bacterium]
MIRIAVIGYGYWGPRIVRNFHGAQGCSVVAICDRDATSLQRASRDFPGIEVTSDTARILASADIDAIAVVTPVWTHFELADAALRNGKHVFVEKPFTSTAVQAEQLIELADRKNLQIMVDHTFLFTGAVRRIRKMVDEGTLGKLYYYDSTRVNLGLFQHDVNVIWDLAPHDLSIVDHLTVNEPECVTASGQSHLNGHEDLAYMTIYYSDNMIAHINVNWLSPVKVRTTLIGGEKKMLVWNDLEADEKLKIYDKGVDIASGQNIYDLLVSYRSGDMWAPRVEQTEALAAEARYFVECVTSNARPFNDGRAGLRIVKLLEAADKSLKSRGAPVDL